MPAELHSQRHEILQEGLEPQHSLRFVLLDSSNQKLGQGDFKKKNKKTKRERKKNKHKTVLCWFSLLLSLPSPILLTKLFLSRGSF